MFIRGRVRSLASLLGGRSNASHREGLALPIVAAPVFAPPSAMKLNQTGNFSSSSKKPTPEAPRASFNTAIHLRGVGIGIYPRSKSIGLDENNTFPNLDLIGRNGRVKLHTILNEKTAIVFQPGASHTNQWQGNDAGLKKWMETKGLPGCTGQLNNFVNEFHQYKAKGTNVIVIMTDKTAEQLQDIAVARKVPYESGLDIFSLTESSRKMLKELGHPFIRFEDKEFLGRVTYVIDKTKNIESIYHRTENNGAAADAADTCSKLSVSVDSFSHHRGRR